MDKKKRFNKKIKEIQILTFVKIYLWYTTENGNFVMILTKLNKFHGSYNLLS